MEGPEGLRQRGSPASGLGWWGVCEDIQGSPERGPSVTLQSSCDDNLPTAVCIETRACPTCTRPVPAGAWVPTASPSPSPALLPALRGWPLLA